MAERTEPADNPCPKTKEPMYATFRKKAAEAGLLHKRFALATNFFMMSGLPMKSIRDAIGETVRKHLEGGAFGAYVESALMSSFWWKDELSSVIPITLPETSALLNNWHRYLDQAVDYTPGPGYMFCGFSTIEDLTINLSQDVLDTLVEAIPIWEGKRDGDVYSEATQRAAAKTNRDGKKLDDEVCDGIDLLATFIVLMQRAGLKPAIATPELEAFLRWFMEPGRPEAGVPGGEDQESRHAQINACFDRHYSVREREKNSPRSVFGGAAGNQADLFGQMGFEALVSTAYNHTRQAKVAPGSAKRLTFDQAAGNTVPLTNGEGSDPRRLSFVFNLVPKDRVWPVLKMCGQTIEVSRKQADRVIFRIPSPFTEPALTWTKLRVRFGNKYIEVEREALPKTIHEKLRPGDWPIFYVFHRDLSFNDGTLEIVLATPEDLTPFADQITGAMLGGIDQMGSTVYTPELTKLLRQALVAQLQTLSSAGVNLRFEIARPIPGAVLDNLKEIFHKGGLKSVSVNREELTQITSEYASNYYLFVPPAPTERLLAIYERAIHLADRLGVSSVFVHDASLDIVVMRNSTDRPPSGEPDPDERALLAHRQAMLCAKAAVPEIFYRRADVASNWPLVLAKQSFYELLGFANDYSQMMASEKREEAARKAKAIAIGRNLRENGYWRTPAKGDFSVVVSPGIVLELPPTVGMAGAGDQSTAAEKALYMAFLGTQR